MSDDKFAEIEFRKPMSPPDNVRVIMVSAAMRNKDGLIITSPRHFDVTCSNILKMLKPEYANTFINGREEQGFVDQWGNFYTREEARIHAITNGQYNRYDSRCQHDYELFSENLY